MIIMKIQYLVISSLFLLIALYLIYRLFVGEYDRLDYLLLMMLLVAGLVNVILIFIRKNKMLK